MNASRPFHQRLVAFAAIAFGAVLAGGAILDSVGNAKVLISESVTYVGTVVLLLGFAALHGLLLLPIDLGGQREQDQDYGIGPK